MKKVYFKLLVFPYVVQSLIAVNDPFSCMKTFN